MQLLFALTLFTSATLLFVVQPMFAKMVLPPLGGTPAVWNTCMVFYQATLLAGYVYAHLSIRWLGPRRQARVHLLLLCLPWLALPIGVAAGWTPPAESNPIPWLLLLLTISVGLPFLVVSASAPMLQAWFSATGHPSAKDPYFLYAASNLGSMVALLGYPLLLEPHLTLKEQAWSWTAGYGLLMGLCLACAIVLWRVRPAVDWAAEEAAADAPGGVPDDAPTWSRRFWWLALSFAPSSLLLGVTTYISTDIASVPLLWVIPLALYLFSFVLVFARRKILPHRLMLLVQPVLVVLVAVAFFAGMRGSAQFKLIFPLHLAAFFVTTMVCHGELVAARPTGRHLTEFYLWMSLGGVLGGMFNALLAPLVFDAVYEYPMMIAAACLLRPAPAEGRRGVLAAWLDFGLPLAVAGAFGWAAFRLSKHNFLEKWAESLFERLPALGSRIEADSLAGLAFLGLAALCVLIFQRRPVRFGLGVFGLLVVSLLYSGEKLRPLYAQRSFFGVLRVKYLDYCNANELLHGSTNHGVQSRDLKESREPWTYYHRDGPVGQLFEALDELRPPRDVGVVGLGTGSIAAYGTPGRWFTFFEIDPAVVAIAENPAFFTYLSDSREGGSRIEIELGDARLSLAADKPRDAEGVARKFDLLLIDAFSSDSIPIHLITREAIHLYFDRLAEHGVLAIHISNCYLDLEPVLGNLAKEAHKVALVCDDRKDGKTGKYASTWVVMARRLDDLGGLAEDPRWKPLFGDPQKRLWTDDFSNVIDVLRGDMGGRWLRPWTWWRSQGE